MVHESQELDVKGPHERRMQNPNLHGAWKFNLIASRNRNKAVMEGSEQDSTEMKEITSIHKNFILIFHSPGPHLTFKGSRSCKLNKVLSKRPHCSISDSPYHRDIPLLFSK